MGQFRVLRHITIKLFKNGDYRSSLLPSCEGFGLVTAVAQVQSLAWEFLHVSGTAQKINKSIKVKSGYYNLKK